MKARTLIILLGLLSLNSSAQPNASLLQRSMIWSPGGENTVVFRKTFTIPKVDKITAFIFADSYYALYVNGNYVLSGPSRFDPKRPEYDTLSVNSYLQQGQNTIAVLVYGGISNGMRMKHAPGFAMMLAGADYHIISDSTWKCSGNTRFKAAVAKWQGLDENINATNSTGDCLGIHFDDSTWQNAVNINENLWGPFFPRSIPLLAEKEVKCELKLPVHVDSLLTIHFDRNYLLTAELNFETIEKTELRIGNTTYIADPGFHSFRTFDSFGLIDASCTLETSAPITIQNVRFFNRIYPFERRGRFFCSDPVLNRLWEMSLHTLEQVTEDGYQDCPWERAEWMGDAAVIEYPLTRVALVGEGNRLGDPRLIRKMIRDISLSADSSGRLKAHHPSDRFDIHAYIEDYSCLWVQSLRDYYEFTEDTVFVNEMWPALTDLMKWFLEQRTESGLIRAREFVIFDNPLKYLTCEGAALNAFVFKALNDASFLAEIVGDNTNAALYKKSAKALQSAFNTVLWNDSLKLYNASTTHEPTFHSALIPLDRGIIESDKRPFVMNWLLDSIDQASQSMMTYTHFWLFEFLYAQDRPEWDTKVLDLIKARYYNFYRTDNIGFTVAESFSGDRPFHNFGSAAAYFMSANILGVQVNLPLSSNLVIIKPQLGYLSQAAGTVVTEHGLMHVDWKKKTDSFEFSIVIPDGKKAIVYLPAPSEKVYCEINEKAVHCTRENRYAVVELSGGRYKGSVRQK
ncbi:hypothetical protein JW960_11960 [candidate division KSB1 bacterium]|nr:hypothetical protein [candidate division KSB1 bacterium]